MAKIIRFVQLVFVSICLMIWYNRTDVIVQPKAKTQPLVNSTIIITNLTKRIDKPGKIWMEPGEVDFKDCPNLEPWMRCVYSADISSYKQSQAVLFRARLVQRDEYPRTRPPGQKWIFFEPESPPQTWDRVDGSLDIWTQFNITSTFTSDSDVPYSRYTKTCAPNPYWKSGKTSEADYAKGKTKMVAWIVSHCTCASRREAYVKELRRYVPVDIFGACGTPKCGTISTAQRNTRCVAKLLQRYKFLVAFENSICEEYYTEKLLKALHLDLIPIVMGAFNYSTLLPRGSFLDVRDFSSPAELAEYLKYLDSNDDAFGSFVAKKNQMLCKNDESIHAKSYSCRLCHYLHTHQGETQIVSDVRPFWGITERCQSPQVFFRNIAEDIIPEL